ncbi:hypothetical protein [Myxococcus sp. RHSTA-1-4]|uniref:hypothetical protein n=1 Tax=Myxococcus sp. RHSTA-1-4 TaxID=2874601 RepID=UPI001CBF12DE|nr:hypothetical protein [Myxococcus sp. RHSTA-1-4]MBZ4415524.1 hypothetical protein [Myxococcus sp. RHSTA-1-4]
MKRLVLVSALAAAGCYTQETAQPKGIGTFQVEVKGLYSTATTPRSMLPVENACATRHGGQGQVPEEVRGTEGCRYLIPRGTVEIDLDITALDVNGQLMESFNGPVSFRVVPGNLTGEYKYRWTKLEGGKGSATVRAGQLYGEMHVWVQDEPPEVDYAEGEVVTGDLPEEPATRTHATGLSRTLLFEEPTIAAVQTPQNGNQETAYKGTYMRIGRSPESGPALRQNCASDDPNNDQPLTLLVTGTDPGGFFVTDITSCRVREAGIQGANIQTPEPSGYLPGRFNSLYIYNYSFPEGLDPGDLLWTVAGSVQEFTATTQLTFPSWSVRERVRLLPQTEWDKYLKLVEPVEINGRLCGYSGSPYITDPLCGYSYGNYKMESLESSLVKIRRVKFPRVFNSCDANGNGQVPFFCADTRGGTWGGCGADSPSDPDVPERQCNIDCTLGIGRFAGQLCTERNTFESFGQFVVEMNPTGAPEANLDGSVPARVKSVTAAVDGNPDTTTWAVSGELVPGMKVHVWCDKAALLRFGGGGSVPESDDVPVEANTVFEHTLAASQAFMWVSAQNEANGAVTCKVGADSRTRINVVTKDAVPDLVVDCREDDPDTGRAQQCRYLRAATFDVTGHLRQVSAARPRWMVLPRDQDDLCCHPGPGMQCPRPIEPCANP